MTTIADSNAVKQGRVLAQHQAALSILKVRMLGPGGTPVHWLDLACGKGQILLHLHQILSADERKQIHYYGYDGNSDFAREAERQATRLGFGSHHVDVGELRQFSSVYAGDRLFDFVTMTNTMHEIPARELPVLLVDCIERLTDTGYLYLFDMEKLEDPELGAVEWKQEDCEVISKNL